jgi:hypothetical protein
VTREELAWRAISALHVSGLMPLYDEMRATTKAGAITRTEYLVGLGALLDKAYEVMDDDDYVALGGLWWEKSGNAG